MVRTQIQLTDEQSAAVKKLARRRGVSVARVIRDSVDEAVRRESKPAQEEIRGRAIAAAGAFRSKETDVSVRHDDYLAEAYAERAQ